MEPNENDLYRYVLATLGHKSKLPRIVFFKSKNSIDAVKANLKEFLDDGYNIVQATGFPAKTKEQIDLAEKVLKLIGKDSAENESIKQFIEMLLSRVFQHGVEYGIDVAGLLKETPTKKDTPPPSPEDDKEPLN